MNTSPVIEPEYRIFEWMTKHHDALMHSKKYLLLFHYQDIQTSPDSLSLRQMLL